MSIDFILKCLFFFFGHIVTNLKSSRKIFKKSSNTKFHLNPFSCSRVVLCGRTGRLDDGNSHFILQFCQSASNDLHLVKKYACVGCFMSCSPHNFLCYIFHARVYFFLHMLPSFVLCIRLL